MTVNPSYDGSDDESKIPQNHPADQVIAVDYSKASIAPQILAAAAATLGSLSMGLNLGWSSPVQPQLTINESLVANCTGYLVLDKEEWSWVASLLTLGAMVGGFFGGTIIDALGRKRGLLLAAVPYIIGWILIITANSAVMLYIGRVLNGLSGGLCSVATPTYLVEISTPEVRGRLGVLYQMTIVIGIWLCSAIGVGLDNWETDDWRWISIICGVIPVVMGVAMLFAPETPYWLLKKGRRDQASKNMQWIRGPDYDMGPEIAQLEASVTLQKAMAGKLSDLLGWWAMKPFLVAIGLMVFQQMSGTNNILFYMANIFEEAGSDLSPLISSLICQSVKLVLTVVSIALVDVAGRKILLFGSHALTAVGMAALGAYFHLRDNDPATADTITWLPIVSLIIFIAGFAIGLGPLPWLMTSEILPRKVKGPATSIAAFLNWGLSFVVTKTFVNMQETMTVAGAYWLFGGFCAVGIIFVIFVPETKGKTYDQIQAYFGNFENAGQTADRKSSSGSSASPSDQKEKF